MYIDFKIQYPSGIRKMNLDLCILKNYIYILGIIFLWIYNMSFKHFNSKYNYCKEIYKKFDVF